VSPRWAWSCPKALSQHDLPRYAADAMKTFTTAALSGSAPFEQD
jgi:hypothetical protein